MHYYITATAGINIEPISSVTSKGVWSIMATNNPLQLRMEFLRFFSEFSNNTKLFSNKYKFVNLRDQETASVTWDELKHLQDSLV